MKIVSHPLPGLIGVIGILLGSAFAASGATTIQWQTDAFSTIVTSDGTPLPETGFTFALGSFADFTPTSSNMHQWAANWKVFALATYTVNEQEVEGGTFVSRNIVLETNWTEPNGSAVTPDFEFGNKQAYFWIRNSEVPQPGSEWLLLQSSAWVFPGGGECCGHQFPVQWGPDAGRTPVWGRQDSLTGGGTASNPVPGPNVLQTYTFEASAIPELSSSLIGLSIGLGLILRRQRNQTRML